MLSIAARNSILTSDRCPDVFFARFQQEDETLSARVKAAFDRKAEKLAKYQRPGVTTILLVENDDIVLILEDARSDPGGLPYWSAAWGRRGV